MQEFPVTVEVHDNVWVVRDDLIGGTKRVYAGHIIDQHPADEYVLATTPEGTMPIFMAQACKERGKMFTLVTGKRKVMHRNTEQVIAAGGQVKFVEVNAFLSHLQAVARNYCKEGRIGVEVHESFDVLRAHRRHLVAFGGAYPFAVDQIARRMQQVTRQLGFEPNEIFCAVGSGTLLRGLLRGTLFSRAVGVMVGQEHTVAEFQDSLTEGGIGLGRLTLVRHRLKYQQESKVVTPFPANRNYEAKAWEMCLAMRNTDIKTLFWNVAGETLEVPT